jgi:hypothetical protein
MQAGCVKQALMQIDCLKISCEFGERADLHVTQTRPRVAQFRSGEPKIQPSTSAMARSALVMGGSK